MSDTRSVDEITKQYTEALEPGCWTLKDTTLEQSAVLSIAISLKRIADMMEKKETNNGSVG